MTRLTEYLGAQPYRGRGIIIGLTKDNIVAAYFIMGRSVNSRNRVFVEKDEDIQILPYDMSLVSDSSLIIYNPIKRKNDFFIISNGDQTETITAFFDKGDKDFFQNALFTRTYEPDEPIFTPRISALVSIGAENGYKLSRIKKSGKQGIERSFFEYQPAASKGHIIHTYCGAYDAEPFGGEPAEIELPATDIDSFADMIWHSLNESNRISIAVKYINLNTKKTQTKIINKLK